MGKSIQRIAKMYLKKNCLLAALSVVALGGCSNTYTLWSLPWEDDEPQVEEVVIYTQEGNQPVPAVAPTEQKNTNDRFVDYRMTDADYREFGEREVTDQYILANGVGSNMAAAIPPTIEEEVTDYEEAVNEAISDAENASSGNTEYNSGDDAVEDWLAEEGSTLKGLLSDWCERSGWRLVWNSNRNYTLAAGAMFRGRFADVSSALIRNFARAKPAPMATFYKGNRVLVVETREDENAYN